MRLVFDVYDGADPNGSALGELTEGSGKTVRVEFNDTASSPSAGAATINRHDTAQAALWVPDNLVKVKLEGGGSGDYFFAFWLGEGAKVTTSIEEQGGDTFTLGGRGALAYLERAILYDIAYASGSGSGPQSDGNWLWEDASYADIITRIFDEAAARAPSPLPDLTLATFATATIPGEFRLPIGLTLLEAIQRLQSLGLQVRMGPFLELTTGDSFTNDYSASVIFEAGVNIIGAGDRQIHATPVKSRMLVQGTTLGGVLKFAEVTDSDIEDDPKIGRREGFVEYGAAVDDEVLIRAGQQALRALREQHEGPITIEVELGDGTQEAEGKYLPFQDYREGDIVTLRVPGVVDAPMLVQAIVFRQTETDEIQVILELEGVPFDPVAVAVVGDKTDTGGGGGGGGGANTRDCEECPPIKPPGDPFVDCDPFQKFNRAIATIIGTPQCSAEYTAPTYNYGSGSPPPAGHTGGSALSAMASGGTVAGTYNSDGTSVGTLSAGDVATWSAGLGQFLSAPLTVSGTIDFPATGVNNPAVADLESVHGGWGAYATQFGVAITIGDFGITFRYSAGYYNIANGGAPHPAGTLSFEVAGGGEYGDGIDIGPDAVTANFAVQIAGGNLRAKIWSTTDPGWQVDTPWAFGAAGDVSLTFGGHPFSESGWNQAVDDFGDGHLGAYTDDTIAASVFVQGACAAGSSATSEWGSDQLISDDTGLTGIGQANGFAYVEWQDQLVEIPISFITNRVEVVNPGYLLPTLGAGGHGDMVFTMPVKFTANKPGASDDATAHVSTRMLITLPGGNVRGVGMYVHDGTEYLEVNDGAGWSETASPSVSKEWNVDQLYILRLDLSQDSARASVTGGPDITLTPLDPWDPGTPAGTGEIEFQTSIVGAALYGSRFLVGEQNIRSLSSSGALLPPFWCNVPNQTQVPRTVIGHGDGVTTVFQASTAYQPGSFDIDVDGQPRVAIELDPAHGLVALEAPPAQGETVYGDWAYASSSIPDETGFDQTGTKVFFPDAPSLTGPDQGPDILAFCEAQESAGTVAAFNPGDYRVDDRVTFGSLDNLRIYAPGVTWQRVDGTSGMDEIIRFVNCNDLLVQGLTVRGPATDADCRDMDYSREDEHAIGLYNVKRATFRGVHARFAFGDGWYMARGDDLDASTLCEHITWEDCDALWTGRNGWSHITGRDFKLYRCLTKTNKLHGYDVEPNRVDDVVADLLLEDFGASDFDAGATPAGHGQSVAIGGGFGDVAATNVTLRRTRMDEPYLYVIGPSSGDPHVGVTVTGTYSDTPGTASVAHVQGWVASDNDGMSMPASGDVT